MQKYNKIKSICLGVLFAIASSGLAGLAMAAGDAAEETATPTAAAPAVAQDALSPDKYIQYLNVAKDWLINNGPNVIVALVILIIGRWVAMWLASLAQKGMGRSKIDETLARFLGKLIYYALLAAVVIAAADQVGIKTTSFIAILGAAGLAIGLALKDSLSNFASGVMLILFRPFKLGDVVTTGSITGKVHQIDIFSTIILTPDNQRHIIPNSMITSNVITNINAEPTRRIDLVVGIGYDDDIKLAKATLEELVKADSRIFTDPAPAIAVSELADSSVNLILRPWVKTEDYWDVRLQLTENIKLTFDEKGISIPYPQQDVHMYQEKSNG